MSSKIPWTDQTWNPIVGCSKISDGCKNCYAEQMAARQRYMRPGCEYRLVTDGGKWNGKVALIKDALAKLLRWRKPRRIFVCSMGDLFHESVPDEWICQVFRAILRAPQHTYQILTKRSERMSDILPRLRFNGDGDGRVWLADDPTDKRGFPFMGAPFYSHPLPNVWIGVTCENQQTADERIPHLLRCPAAVRFVSVEPMLSDIKINRYMAIGGPLGGWYMTICEHCGWVGSSEFCYGDWENVFCPLCQRSICGNDASGIDWVICGGESGPGARPMHSDWARSLRDQCQDAGVPFMLKQWGEWLCVYDRDNDDPDWADLPKRGRNGRWLNFAGGSGFHGERVVFVRRVGKKRAGRLLDGVLHDAFPEVVA